MALHYTSFTPTAFNHFVVLHQPFLRMAESVLSEIATETLKKLGSLALQEIELACFAANELSKVKDTITTVKAVFLDAEEQQSTNHEVKDWLEKLSDAVYDADDLLDDFNTELLRREVLTLDKRAKKVRIFFSSLNQIAFSLKMGHKVKAVRERFDAIAQDRKNFQLTERFVEKRVDNRKREETHSFACVEEVIGRDSDKTAVLKLLLDCNVEKNVSVVAVVGTGGMGKTTLAQLVYNDNKITQHFGLKMWVCVSEVFDVESIVKKIFKSIIGRSFEDAGLDYVQNELRKSIDGKRYLLVLDDVWNDDRGKWLELSKLLMGGGRGSKILVTTRMQIVATISDAYPHPLERLSEYESWSLFKKMAFRQGEEQETPQLVKVGREIVKKCSGVPLAIRVLGCLLYSKETEDERLNLLKISQTESIISIDSILNLSYHNLPTYLKPCFRFSSLYPKDNVFYKQQLIQLWIANGIIQSSDENGHLEEKGDLYFMDLLSRSLFQHVDRDKWGNVTSCKMHDLVHDLAQSVSRHESCQVNRNTKDVPPRIRHVSSLNLPGESWELPGCLLKADKIRTLIMPQLLFRHGPSESNRATIVSAFKRLRVVDLHSFSMTTVPECVSKLKHLRYLDLSWNMYVKTLPSAISRLQNLQTLILNYCKELETLPRDMKKLINLRHLELKGCEALTGMPCGLGRLTSLRALTDFVVSPDRPKGGLSELKGLNYLRGGLTIRGLGKGMRTEEKEEEEAKYLEEKAYLQSLELKFDDGEDRRTLEVVFEGLKPDPNLKELTIHDYGGASLPSWMMINIGLSLPKLVQIDMWSCKRCKYLCRLGQLPSLQFLGIYSLNSLEYVEEGCSITSAGGGRGGGDEPWEGEGIGSPSRTFFPSLKELSLYELPKLKGWWGSEAEAEAEAPRETTVTTKAAEEHRPPWQSFPCLSKLSVIRCSKMTSIPPHPSIERLDLENPCRKLLLQQLTTPVLTTLSSSLVPLSKLTTLAFRTVDDLVYLPEEAFRNLTSLRQLYIGNCQKLASLSKGLQHLRALEFLNIYCCPELDLSDDDDGLHFQGLTSLTGLDVSDLRKLVSLPVGLQHVTSLQTLKIYSCENLKTLPEWIGNFTSLQELVIKQCPKMISLPQGLHCLTALRVLKIAECARELYDRCQKETGEDWPKVAHITNVTVVLGQLNDDGW